jgi:Flp pilus assembly protein TadG
MAVRTSGRRGQAALESMMMMAFVLLLVFGLMHLSMLTVTRYMVNYAAHAAGRASVVGNNPTAAARAVLANINWLAREGGTMPVSVQYVNRDGWGGYEVTTRVPFGLPIYRTIAPEGIAITGFAPLTIDGNAPTGGDNGN